MRNTKKDSHDRNEFFKKFSDENGIDGNLYYFDGNGSVNQPFDEYRKSSISLSVSDTENNLEKFGKDFKKSKRFDDLSDFKKISKLLKKFQDECIANKVVINLYDIRFVDYFKELHLGGCSTSRFVYEGKYYLKISTSRYDTITPECDGFVEIKGSEFHTKLEELESQEES